MHRQDYQALREVISNLPTGTTKVFSARDYRAADLSGINLVGVSFVDCQFNGANLKGSHIGEMSFVDCDFSGAQLDGVDCYELDIANCRFDGASLRGSFIMQARIARNNFRGIDGRGLAIHDYSTIHLCDFDGAHLQGSCFPTLQNVKNCNFSETIFEHIFGSNIGEDMRHDFPDSWRFIADDTEDSLDKLSECYRKEFDTL